MDQTFLQLISLLVDLTNRIAVLQQEKAALKEEVERLTPKEPTA